MNNPFVLKSKEREYQFIPVQLHFGEEIIKPFYAIQRKIRLNHFINHKDYKKAIQLSKELPLFNDYLDKPVGEFLEYLDMNSHYQELEAFLNKHGNKKFGKFLIKDNLNNKGIYVYKLKDKLVYIGRCCDDFNKRINYGYGNLDSYNCMKNGQPTNCKLNSKIFENQNDVSLFVCTLDELNETEISYHEALILNNYAKPKWNENIPSQHKFFKDENGKIIETEKVKKAKSAEMLEKPEQKKSTTLMKFIAKNGEFYLQCLENAHFKFVTKEGDTFVQRKAKNEENGAMFQRLKLALRQLNLSENIEKPFPLFSTEKMPTFNLPDFEHKFKPLMTDMDRIKTLTFKADDQEFQLRKNLPNSSPRFEFLSEIEDKNESTFKKLKRLASHLIDESEIENLSENKKTNNGLGYLIFKQFRGKESEVISLPGFQFKQNTHDLETSSNNKKQTSKTMETERIKFKTVNDHFYLEKNKTGTQFTFSKFIDSTFIPHEPDGKSARGVLEDIARIVVGHAEVDSMNIKNNNSLGPRIFKALKDELPCVVFLGNFGTGFNPIKL